MKKFLTRLLFLLPIVFLIVGINYKEDPANIVSKGPYEMGIVELLIDGKNVTNVTNYDERLLQKYFIDKMHNCPSTIVLGSSRVMQLGNSYFNDESLINNGVSGATLEDILAIYNLYENKGCKIKKIIIGVEPYYLNDNHDQSRWRVLNQEVNNCLKQINLETYTDNHEIIDSKFAKYKELFSISYFKNSWSYLIRGVDVHYSPTTSAINKDLTKLSDGSIYYGEDSRNSSLQVINGYATLSITETPMYSMREFNHLSKKYQTIFVRFIEYLQQKQIDVELFISPYHPIVYNFCKQSNDYQIVFEAEKYYREFAENHHIKVIGNYDPSFYHFTDSSFYDGFHCKEKSLSIIWRK